MNTRQQDYISELSQHEQNAFQKRSQASGVKEWSEEKMKSRNKEKLYVRWCEIAAQVLQQDAANMLMRSLSLLDTCARWTVWARIRLDQAEQICSSAYNWQTSRVKHLCADEQVYQGAHDRAKRGSDLLVKFKYCIEKAYTELIHKSKDDENRFRENLPVYDKRLAAVRKSFSDESTRRRDHLQNLFRKSKVQEQQLQDELEHMEYASLPDADDDVWEKTVKRLGECRSMKASYEKQYEHVHRLVLAASLDRLAIADSCAGVVPDVQMQDWLDEFYFNHRRSVNVFALTDVSETCSLQSYEVIAPDGDRSAPLTKEGECHAAELDSLRMQLKESTVGASSQAAAPTAEQVLDQTPELEVAVLAQVVAPQAAPVEQHAEPEQMAVLQHNAESQLTEAHTVLLEERRIDPGDGEAYTLEEMRELYAGKMKNKAINKKWQTCEIYVPPQQKKYKKKAAAAVQEEKLVGETNVQKPLSEVALVEDSMVSIAS